MKKVLPYIGGLLIVVLLGFFFFGDELGYGDLLPSTGKKKTVKLSVVRFNEEVISFVVVANGSQLPQKHSITKDDFENFADYQLNQKIIKEIESQTSTRFIPERNGFSHEEIDYEITVK